MNLVYDVYYNIAKFEEHLVDGRPKKVWVHRKGATAAYKNADHVVDGVHEAGLSRNVARMRPIGVINE